MQQIQNDNVSTVQPGQYILVTWFLMDNEFIPVWNFNFLLYFILYKLKSTVQ